jgi:hypothetical protein
MSQLNQMLNSFNVFHYLKLQLKVDRLSSVSEIVVWLRETRNVSRGRRGGAYRKLSLAVDRIDIG